MYLRAAFSINPSARVLAVTPYCAVSSARWRMNPIAPPLPAA